MFEAGLTNQFKLDILNGVHHPEDDYRIALFLQKKAEDKNKSAVSYDSTGELKSGSGYTQGGKVLTGFTSGLEGDAAYIDFDDVSWKDATFSADAAVIYNHSKDDKILVICALGNFSVTNGTIAFHFPEPGRNAVIVLP